MKLVSRARYAVQMMVELAEGQSADATSLAHVAGKTNISRRYLEQLALALKHAGLVRAVRGMRGGYHLARPAEEIRLGEVIEAAIGPINIVDCVCQPDLCVKSEQCGSRKVYSLINEKITGVLSEVTLAELAQKSALDKSQGIPKGDSLGCPAT